MFQRYELIQNFGNDKSILKYRARVKIIDTDFEEETVIYTISSKMRDGDGMDMDDEIEIAIIDTYTKRGLPVAPNLIRHMLYLQKEHAWPISEQVRWQKQFNYRWYEVEADMQMYLTFS